MPSKKVTRSRASFAARVVKLESLGQKRLTQDCRENSLLSLIEDSIRFFPLMVVGTNDRGYTLMHLIGKASLMKRRTCFVLFPSWAVSRSKGISINRVLYTIHGLHGSDGAPFAIPVETYLESDSSLSHSAILKIVDLVEEAKQRNKENEIVVPVNFWVFRYRAFLIGGQHERKPFTKIGVVKADSLDDAAKEFAKETEVDVKSVCRFEFHVFYDGMWRPLVLKGKRSGRVYSSILVGPLPSELRFEIQ